MKRPDAIFVGDIHARDDQPVCRLDNFIETQKRKYKWLKDLWLSLGEPIVFQSGDLFHKWKSSPEVINMVLDLLPPMITIPGNPGKHNYFNEEGFDKDALRTVELSGLGWKVLRNRNLILEGSCIVVPALWGSDVPKIAPSKYKIKTLLLTHRMILDGVAPFDGDNAEDFLVSNTGYDIIITGHNHKPIEVNIGRRKLINPGSFTRQTADETHKPVIYLWWSDTNLVEPVFVPIEEGIITRDHVDIQKQRDDRLMAFVEKLSGDNRSITVNFKDNLLQALSGPEIRESVKSRVMEALDG